MSAAAPPAPASAAPGKGSAPVLTSSIPMERELISACPAQAPAPACQARISFSDQCQTGRRGRSGNAPTPRNADRTSRARACSRSPSQCSAKRPWRAAVHRGAARNSATGARARLFARLDRGGGLPKRRRVPPAGITVAIRVHMLRVFLWSRRRPGTLLAPDPDAGTARKPIPTAPAKRVAARVALFTNIMLRRQRVNKQVRAACCRSLGRRDAHLRHVIPPNNAVLRGRAEGLGFIALRADPFRRWCGGHLLARC